MLVLHTRHEDQLQSSQKSSNGHWIWALPVETVAQTSWRIDHSLPFLSKAFVVLSLTQAEPHRLLVLLYNSVHSSPFLFMSLLLPPLTDDNLHGQTSALDFWPLLAQEGPTVGDHRVSVAWQRLGISLSRITWSCCTAAAVPLFLCRTVKLDLLENAVSKRNMRFILLIGKFHMYQWIRSHFFPDVQVPSHFEAPLQFSAFAVERGLCTSTDDLQYLRLSKQDVEDD